MHRQTIPLRINLGAGARPLLAATWQNTDLTPAPGIDKVFDLDRDPWPYLDAEALDLNACHVLEHLRNPEHFFREAARVLRPGGHFLIRVPSANSDRAMGDMTHIRPWFWDSFSALIPGRALETFNLQATNVGSWTFPDAFMVDEFRLIVDPAVASWRFPWIWRRWVPTLERYLRNITCEMWVRLHRLPEGLRMQMRAGEVERPQIEVRYMTMKETMNMEMHPLGCVYSKGN